MWNLRTRPIYHEVVTLPVAGRSNGVRAIVVEYGILAPALRYLDLPRNRLKSPSWQSKCCRAIGLLYDYVKAAGRPANEDAHTRFLSDFVLALACGSEISPGNDPTGLGWKPISGKEVQNIIRYINGFSEYCSEQYGGRVLNPTIDPHFGEQIAAYQRLEAKNQYSLLRHTRSSHSIAAEAARVRTVQPKRAPLEYAKNPPACPDAVFEAILSEGLRRPGHRSFDAPWMQWNIRDQLIIILQRFGGIRESEALNLFVNDILPDPRNPKSVRVILRHPELAQTKYQHPDTGLLTTGTRMQFLADVYGLQPRSQISGKLRAGWKDLLLDKGSPEYLTEVRWFPAAWGERFAILLKIYVENILPTNLDHPYLFVSLRKGKDFGRPYTVSAYAQNLEAAVHRCGYAYSKQSGTTSHGLRHAYGQSLMKSKVSEKIIQLAMHHKSISSQHVYTRSQLSEINAALVSAQERISTYNTISFPAIQ
jgi:integrase